MLNQFVCRDADKARRKAALRHERSRRARGDPPHRGRNRDVLGQVEVVQAFGARHLGDGDVAEIGQAGYQRDRLVLTHVPGEGFHVARVEVEGADGIEPMRRGNRFGDAGHGVGELNAIAAAFGQQAGYEGADLAGAEYEDLLH